ERGDDERDDGRRDGPHALRDQAVAHGGPGGWWSAAHGPRGYRAAGAGRARRPPGSARGGAPDEVGDELDGERAHVATLAQRAHRGAVDDGHDERGRDAAEAADGEELRDRVVEALATLAVGARERRVAPGPDEVLVEAPHLGLAARRPHRVDERAVAAAGRALGGPAGVLGPARDDDLAGRADEVVEAREVVGRRGERDVGAGRDGAVRHRGGALAEDEVGGGAHDRLAACDAAGLAARRGPRRGGLGRHRCQCPPPERLSPTTPATISTREITLRTVTGSSNRTTARTAVSAAPIPTQTP